MIWEGYSDWKSRTMTGSTYSRDSGSITSGIASMAGCPVHCEARYLTSWLTTNHKGDGTHAVFTASDEPTLHESAESKSSNLPLPTCGLLGAGSR